MEQSWEEYLIENMEREKKTSLIGTNLINEGRRKEEKNKSSRSKEGGE